MLDCSTIVVIVYACCYVTLLLVISCVTYNSSESKKGWISRTWKKRGIYAPVLVHIYDTSTDIGVIVIWGQLAFQDGNDDVKHIDMMTMFILGCVFLVVYRILSAIGFLAVHDGLMVNYLQYYLFLI